MIFQTQQLGSSTDSKFDAGSLFAKKLDNPHQIRKGSNLVVDIQDYPKWHKQSKSIAAIAAKTCDSSFEFVKNSHLLVSFRLFSQIKTTLEYCIQKWAPPCRFQRRTILLTDNAAFSAKIPTLLPRRWVWDLCLYEIFSSSLSASNSTTACAS